MSVELQKAKEKIAIIEKIEQNPELIFTDIYDEDDMILNFLYSVNIDGKYIYHYFIEQLQKIPALKGVELDFHGDDLYLYTEGLKYGEYASYQDDDKLLEIDLCSKTFVVCKKFLERYQNLMEDCKLKVEDLDAFWKQYENFGFKGRFKLMKKSFSSKKRFFVKIQDFFFLITVSKGKINKRLNEEKEKIAKRNERNKEHYDKDVKQQQYYLENAPEHTAKACSRQNELIHYFESIGYKVDTEAVDEW